MMQTDASFAGTLGLGSVYLGGAPRHGEEHLQRDAQLLGTMDVAVSWRVGDDSLHASG